MKNSLNSIKSFPHLLLFMFMCISMPDLTGQITVFSDDFNTNTSATWTTSGPIGASAWSVNRSGDDWGGRRNTSPLQLELTNDVGATANIDGYVFASTPTTAFTSPYMPTLSQGGFVTWSFNMRQIRADPSGFNAGNYGVAMIFAGETATTNATGNGYAVVLGQSGSTDPVRLAKYSVGILGNTTITDIIASNTTGLADFGTEYLSIKVTYNPCNNNQWELFVRNDGSSAFADPLTGTLTSQGTASDNTYTSTALNMMDAYWQGSTTANQTAFFDNVVVSVIPKPSLVLGSVGMVCQGSTSANLPYSALMGGGNQYSITYNSESIGAGFVNVAYTSLPATPIMLVIPASAPSFAFYGGTLKVKNSTTLCESVAYSFTVSIMGCLAAPSMEWVLLNDNAETHGSCVSASDCDLNKICYGLKYVPNVNGNMTSYGTGFFITCTTSGNPVVPASNKTCLTGTNASGSSTCFGGGAGQTLVNSSANSLNTPVLQGVPIFIHQICFTIPVGESITISEDPVTDLATSIDLTGGGFTTEFPAYNTLMVDRNAICAILPVKWLSFTATRYDELMSQLNWTTADEINNSHFEIQRSNEVEANFETIGTVEATTHPGAINTYSFIDRHAHMGQNYYRIKQIDLDGKFQFTPVRDVSFNSGRFSVQAWPNPVNDIINISVNHAEQAGLIQLIDLNGKEVLRMKFERGITENKAFVSTLPSGIYTLLVVSGSDRFVDKIVIME